jgi:fumarate reductase subunit C
MNTCVGIWFVKRNIWKKHEFYVTFIVRIVYTIFRLIFTLNYYFIIATLIK